MEGQRDVGAGGLDSLGEGFVFCLPSTYKRCQRTLGSAAARDAPSSLRSADCGYDSFAAPYPSEVLHNRAQGLRWEWPAWWT